MIAVLGSFDIDFGTCAQDRPARRWGGARFFRRRFDDPYFPGVGIVLGLFLAMAADLSCSLPATSWLPAHQ